MMTERQFFNTIAGNESVMQNPEIAEFVNKKIEKLASKPDELLENIVELLKNEKTLFSIKNIVERTDSTSQKVVSRLTKLIENGVVERVPAKLEDKRVVMTYGYIGE